MSLPTLEDLGVRPPAYRRAEAELTFRRRLRAWVGAHRQSLAWVPLLLGIVGLVHGWGLAHSPSLADDEGTYMAQAWSSVHEHRLEVYTYWYDHPPLGWMQIGLYSVFSSWLAPGAHSVVAGRTFMVALGVISAGLVYVVSRRLGMRRLYASVAVLLFGLSPLAVDYQRMVYLDNVAVPWVLGAVALAISPRRSLWAATCAGACLAVAVLSKETFVLFAPAVFMLLWQRSDPKTRSFCLTGAAATFALVLVAYPLYALLKGELFAGAGHVSLWQGLVFQLSGRASSGSMFASSSNAHATVASWLSLDSWLLLLGLVALVVNLPARRNWPLVVAFALPVLVAIRGGYLPGPYVIGLLPFAALLVSAALEVIAGKPILWTSSDGWRTKLAGLARDRSGSARRASAAILAVALLVALAAAWRPGDRGLMSGDATTPTFQAEAWIESNVARNNRLIVDDSLWVDLVDHGFDPRLGAVWFQKLDFTVNLDPSVARSLPEGWRDFAFVVSTPALRSSLAVAPKGFLPVRSALTHSVVVASFGEGPAVVEVRRIIGSSVQAVVADWPAG